MPDASDLDGLLRLGRALGPPPGAGNWKAADANDVDLSALKLSPDLQQLQALAPRGAPADAAPPPGPSPAAPPPGPSPAAPPPGPSPAASPGAPSAPGPAPSGDPTSEQMMNDPDMPWNRGGGQQGSSGGSMPPGPSPGQPGGGEGGGGYMLGNVPVITAAPPGVKPLHDPTETDQAIQGLTLGHQPVPESLKAHQDLFNNGFVIGTDNRPYIVKGGKADPDIIKQTAGAQAGAEAGARAPYEMVPAWVRLPDGSIVKQDTPLSSYVPGGKAAGGGTFTGEPYFTPAQQNDQKAASDEFAGLRQIYAGNQSGALNLQNFLDAASKVGTGPGTKFSGDVGNWLKSVGVDPGKLGLADPGAVAVMNKAAQRLVFSTIHDVTNRPAYQEFKMAEGANPSADMDPSAVKELAAALQAKMNWENAKFEAWNSDARQPGHSSYNFDPVTWGKSNPMPQYMGDAMSRIPTIPESGAPGTRGGTRTAPAGGPAPPIATPAVGPAAPRRSRFDPTSGTIVPVGPAG
jgi:hypothetical protein